MTTGLPSPVVIRYRVSKEGLITDSQTGFMWAPVIDKHIDWLQANAYVKDLRAGGFSDWRLPTRQELMRLWKPSEEYEAHTALHVVDKDVWSSETAGSDYAFCINFDKGKEDKCYQEPAYTSNFRVLPVRSRK